MGDDHHERARGNEHGFHGVRVVRLPLRRLAGKAIVCDRSEEGGGQGAQGNAKWVCI